MMMRWCTCDNARMACCQVSVQESASWRDSGRAWTLHEAAAAVTLNMHVMLWGGVVEEDM